MTARMLSGLLASSVLFAASAFAQDPAPGIKWKQTTSMQMAGMSMPATTRDVCVATGREQEALAAPDKNCVLSNVQRTGNGMRADVRCTGEHAMEGTIEQVSDGPDKSHGTFTIRSAQGEMVMKTTSVKLGEACDANADLRRANQMVADAQRQSEANKARTCGDLVTTGLQKRPGDVGAIYGYVFGVPGAKAVSLCDEPKYRAAVCAAMGTRAGYVATQNAAATNAAQGDSLQARLNKCSLGDAGALRAKLVQGAEQENDWGFILAEAPELAQQIGERECSGRGFSVVAKDSRYTEFCSRWSVTLAGRQGPGAGTGAAGSAGATPNSGAAANAEGAATGAEQADNAPPAKEPETPAGKAKDIGGKARRALGGIFGGR
ncbi:MAG TPA: DUF3617 family protein [Gammaproteobacteria bacterium]|nr:DUF3617 family protein [Gammaproteobacteria bacterium]